MSDLFYDDNTMADLRGLELDLLIYNYGEDLQVLKEENQKLRDKYEALRVAAQAIADNQESKTTDGQWVVVRVEHLDALSKALEQGE